MGTKMKGLLKGLRYISQIFEDEEKKEEEMQIGLPTDVKHVAHIGWDGPSVDTPSWMKEFSSSEKFQTAPLDMNGEPTQNPEAKWVSEDSSGRRGRRTHDSTAKGSPRSSRRQSAPDGSTGSDSPSKEPSKPRQSRRHLNPSSSKDPSSSSKASSKANRQQADPSLDTDPTSKNVPNIPKKSRRKKSKESINGVGGSTKSSKSKAVASSSNSDPFSDASSEMGSLTISKKGEGENGNYRIP